MEGGALDVLGAVLVDYLERVSVRCPCVWAVVVLDGRLLLQDWTDVLSSIKHPIPLSIQRQQTSLSSQVGSTISDTVETSGRSSAHTNVYDILNAVEECTAPAAAHMSSSSSLVVGASMSLPAARGGNDVGGNGGGQLTGEFHGRGWEGLASFLFGPDWHLIPLEGEEAASSSSSSKTTPSFARSDSLGKGGPTVATATTTPAVSGINNNVKSGGKTILPKMPAGATTTAAGGDNRSTSTGKQLPIMRGAAASSGGEKNVSFSMDRQASVGSGGVNGEGANGGVGGGENSSIYYSGVGRWDAPYLGNVAPFPSVTSTEAIANPHRLGRTKISLSLHDLASEREACRDSSSGPSKRLKGAADGKSIGTSKTNPVTSRAAKLAEESAMRAALRIPAGAYWDKDTLWGCISEKDESSSERKSGDDEGEDKSGEKKKAVGAKVKFDSKTGLKQQPAGKKRSSSELDLSASSRMPSYVPNFLPPYPSVDQTSTLEYDRKLSVSAANAMGSVLVHVTGQRGKGMSSNGRDSSRGGREDVRRSVIELGRAAAPSYWGSEWLDDNEGGSSSTNTVSHGVSAGSEVLVANAVVKEVAGSAAARKANSDSQVVPIGRASGSRVSKILEGSMN